MTSGIGLLSLPDLHRRRYLAGKETKQLNLGQSFTKYWAMIFFLSPSHSNPIPAAPISRCKCTVEPKVCGQSGKGTKNVGGRRQKRLVPHYDICNVDVCLCVCVWHFCLISIQASISPQVSKLSYVWTSIPAFVCPMCNFVFLVETTLDSPIRDYTPSSFTRSLGG